MHIDRLRMIHYSDVRVADGLKVERIHYADTNLG
jgi:hypothetical protein